MKMKVEMAGISAEGLTSYGAHAHNLWEIVVCLKGGGIIQLNERTMTVQTGTILCQPAGTVHRGVALNGYQDMWFHVSDFVPPNDDDIPAYRDDEEKRFTRLGLMRYESLSSREPNSSRIVEGLWNAMYALLVSWSGRRTADPLVEGIVRQMVLNISNCEFDLASCLRESGYCLDHCRRRFKQETGVSPAAYLIGLRMEQARRMLELNDRGGHTVRQIARMCGFSDPYYFSTVFKKAVGCSPSDYMNGDHRD